jgi:hypothetical protein
MARRPSNLSSPTDPTWPTLPLVGFRRNLRMAQDQIAARGLPRNQDRPSDPVPDRCSPLEAAARLSRPPVWPVRRDFHPDGRD